MSARITKAEVDFLMPLPAAPRADRAEALRQAAARAEWTALAQRLGRLADAVLGWPERVSARAQLQR